MLRRHSLGRFDDLVEAVTHDAAMNIWLDLHTSVVGRPNENYARELMELFTLGVDGYAQVDVAEAARAFTCYGLERPPGLRRPVGTRLRPALHDYGTKTVLGRSGLLTGRDVIATITQRPECHRYVVARLRRDPQPGHRGLQHDLRRSGRCARSERDRPPRRRGHPHGRWSIHGGWGHPLSTG